MDIPSLVQMLERHASREGRPRYWPLDPLAEWNPDLPLEVLLRLAWRGDACLARTAAAARRTVLFGAARAARAGLDARPAEEQSAPVCDADMELAQAAFRGAAGASPLKLDLVLAAFVPTVIIYPDAPPDGALHTLWLGDANGPRPWMNGQLLLGEPVGDRQRRVAGEVHFVPPVHRGERARRRAWVDANDIDPPPRRGPGGPYRRLADSEQWRLGTLGWRERLVLAGALATRLPVTAVICGPAMLPRVGYVVQKVALVRRTLVHVPWEALPDDLQACLQATRTVHALGEHLLECGEELP